MTGIRSSILILGPTYSGKTTSLNLLKETLNQMKSDEMINRLTLKHQAETNPATISNFKSLISMIKELNNDIDQLEEVFLKQNFKYINI